MKKILILVLAMLMVVSLFAGCGDKKVDEPAKTDDTAADAPADDAADAPAVTGEVYDAGNVSAIVPEGWKAFPVMDVFAEEEDATDPDGIQIGKGAETEWDLFSQPYVLINYYGPDTTMMAPDKEWYDEAEDIAPFTAGGYTWEGFTAKSFDLPIAMVWTDAGDGNEYQVSIWLQLEEGGDSISVTDADVQAIIASVQPSA